MWQKRSQIQMNDKTYTVIRVYDHQIYMVIRKKKIYWLHQFDTDEQFQIALKNYYFFQKLCISVPKIIDFDEDLKLILQEYLTGHLASNRILKGEQPDFYFEQIQNIASTIEKHGKCLNYFPSHFIEHKKKLYYVLYDCFDLDKDLVFDSNYKLFWIDSIHFVLKMKKTI